MGDGYFPGASGPARRDAGLLPPYIEAALFLLCGMLIGGGATVLLLDRSVQHMLTEPKHLRENLLIRMESRLGLSEQQQSDATAIVDRHFRTLETIRGEVQPKIAVTLDALRDDIAGILDDSQRAIWISRFEEIRGQWRPGPLAPAGAEGGAATLP